MAFDWSRPLTLKHTRKDKTDIIRIVAHPSNHRPQREPTQSDYKDFLITIIVPDTPKQQNEGANRQRIARDEPAQRSRVGRVEVVADDVNEVQGLAERDLSRELRNAHDADEEDLARERVEWIGIFGEFVRAILL